MVRPTYSSFPSSATVTSATKAAEVTPANIDLPYVTRAVYVGTGGALTVTMAGDEVPVTFTNVPDGSMLAISVVRISAATTASNIVAMY